MNAMVAFRANAAGNLSPRPAERVKARESIVANFRAQIEGIQRALVQEQLQAEGADQVAKIAGGAAAPAPQTKAASDTGNTGNDATGNATAPNDQLGKNEYLQLLVQQLSNQDPLQPTDNSQMIAQLAQFSSLEQMQNLNTSFGGLSDNFTTLSGNIDQLNFISAQGLLGKYVEGVDGTGAPITGTVDSVHLDGSIVMLTVAGKTMPMSGVLAVANSQSEAEAIAKAAADAAQKAAQPGQ